MKQVSFFYFVFMIGIIIIGCKTSNNPNGDNSDILGCMEVSACNYDSKANIPNDSCVFTKDCNGECGGIAELDVCGVCGGSGEIYECGCSNIAVGTCDCYNNILDGCDICGGDNTSCTGCTDPNASNHDPEAIIDDGSCILDIDDLQIIPEIFSISNIYPNPFNPITTIKYGLPDYGLVNIFIYDISGRQVAKLMNNIQTPGFHSVVWEASSYPSGLYFIRMVCNNFTDTRKILLIK